MRNKEEVAQMPTIMIILNMVFGAGIVLAIVGLCAWGIITDRPFAAFLTNRALARAQGLTDRRRAADRRRVPREASGYRGPLRRAIDAGA
jgi:hypothetical protein